MTTIGRSAVPARAVLPFLVAAALLAGCRSVPPVPAPTPTRPVPGRDLAVGGPAARVVAEARSVLGAPYRYSGATPRGFDCSGLVSWAFAAAGVSLPRTAAEQATAGRWGALDDHVGLVVSGAGEPLRMIHASSSRGVVETDVLRSDYWLYRLRFGRRFLPGGG